MDDLVPQVWYVDAETYEWIVWKLEQPPEDIPGLRELMNRSPVWENNDTNK